MNDMMNEELLGTLALVDPGLQNDPGARQGKIGIITYVDALKEQIYLSFEEGMEGMYPAGDLLKLKDKEKLMPEMVEKAAALKLTDYTNLYKISLLQDTGRGKDLWHALEIARDNPAIRSGSLEPVSNSVSYRQVQAVGR